MQEEYMINMDLVVQSQLMLETMESYQRLPQNKFRRKSLIKQLIKELEIDSEKDFNRIFNLDQETLMSIQQNYEYALKNLAVKNIPNKVIQSQMWAAYEKDPLGIEATVHRILKKK